MNVDNQTIERRGAQAQPTMKKPKRQTFSVRVDVAKPVSDFAKLHGMLVESVLEKIISIGMPVLERAVAAQERALQDAAQQNTEEPKKQG